MKKLFLSLILLSAASLQTVARNGFAIVIDPESYKQTKAEVDAYAAAVEKYNNMHVYTVLDKWGIPDSIRATLKAMYTQKNDPIVGAVLVGDIPVAMVRDGQHMTSAFKMKQDYPRKQSSIPSDRFYDDFGLQFKYIDKDTDAPYFYYSVTAESEHVVRPNIFSGRIRPTEAGGTSKYEKLRMFLKKAVAVKEKQNPLSQLMFFSGHGYVSESKVARMDEKISYFEHFPFLKTNRNCMSYIDHSDHNPVKQTLMNELMRTDLDLAVLHHHGYWDTEYFNGIAPINTVRAAKEFININLREHIYAAKQRGKNADSVKAVLLAKFDVPESWVPDALSDSVAKVDSTFEAASDLHLEDFAGYGYQPNVPLVIIDACYCGSFHQTNCIANEYIFQPGSTVAVVANTVNSLQDKWYDRFIGLLSKGGVAAELVRYAGYLENHLIGDPTFQYAAEAPLDIEGIIYANKTSDWKKLLKSTYPDVQALAIEHLARKQALTSDYLLKMFQQSPYGIVRLEILTALAQHYKDANYVKCLQLASQDSYELVQRLALRYMAGSGDESLIPELIAVSIANNTSDRVNFDALAALSSFKNEKLQAEFAKQFDSPSVCYIHKDSIRKLISLTIERYAARANDYVDDVLNDSTTAKERILNLRSMRNNVAQHRIPDLIEYCKTKAPEEVQEIILEMLGWHTCSAWRNDIMNAALEISKSYRYSEKVRNEALKTYNRVHEKI